MQASSTYGSCSDYSAKGLASSAFVDWLSYVGYGRERARRRDIAASRNNLKGLKEMIVIAVVLYGVSYFVLALSNALSISLIIALVLGFSLMMQMASRNTILKALSMIENAAGC